MSAQPEVRAMQVGETVQLKSGGPIMTITGSGGDGSLQCMWFPEGSTAQASVGYFPATALQAARVPNY
ncbi:YodC family protein [Variovorax boronicumulans]|uniref:YodC family protein n=1 Tax=Variovorax boronicumulans TaxID=436515 RepID=UPI00358FCF7E